MLFTSTPAIRLEPVSPTEYPALLEVWEASVRATHHFVTEAEIAFYRPLILNEYLKMMDLVCARDAQGNIAGFAGTAYGKLEMLFLHPESRGKGIGKKLVQHVIRHSNVTKVDVNEENAQALGFYLHLGFHVIGRTETDSAGMPHPILYLALK